jgi:hypothetical protein
VAAPLRFGILSGLIPKSSGNARLRRLLTSWPRLVVSSACHSARPRTKILPGLWIVKLRPN